MSAIKRLVIASLVFTICGDGEAAAATKDVGPWRIISGKSQGKDYCYAYTNPYRTRAYDETRDSPYLILEAKGKDSVTLGIDPGFDIDSKQGITLRVNGREHLIDDKLNSNVWTYSAIQDKAIISDMIKDGYNVVVRSYDTEGNTAVDYYSLDGILHTLKYLESNCQGIQTASK